MNKQPPFKFHKPLCYFVNLTVLIVSIEYTLDMKIKSSKPQNLKAMSTIIKYNFYNYHLMLL